MRPLYETQEDLDNEDSIASIIKIKWGLTAIKMPRSYHLDYALRDGQYNIRAFAEIKTRTTNKLKYSTYLISLAKIMNARRLTEYTGLSSILIVKWLDEVGWINLKTDGKLGFGGRRDRNDWQDQEPVIFLPIEQFKSLKEVGNDRCIWNSRFSSS